MYFWYIEYLFLKMNFIFLWFLLGFDGALGVIQFLRAFCTKELNMRLEKILKVKPQKFYLIIRKKATFW